MGEHASGTETLLQAGIRASSTSNLLMASGTRLAIFSMAESWIAHPSDCPQCRVSEEQSVPYNPFLAHHWSQP
jgi:hypothetical protein